MRVQGLEGIQIQYCLLRGHRFSKYAADELARQYKSTYTFGFAFKINK